MKAKLIGVVTATIGLSVAAAACSTGSTTASRPPISHSVAGRSPSAVAPTSPAPATTAPATTPGPGSPAAMAGLVGAGCDRLPATGRGSVSGMASAPVITAAAANPLLADLAQAVRVAGLTSTLDSARAITVFAPNDNAFNGFGTGNLNTLLASKSDLRRVLDYLVVNGRITPAELASGAPLRTLLGTLIQPHRRGRVYKVNGVKVMCGNIQTANATVYIIDGLLIPQ